jgi:hypothetical protein
MFDIHLFEYRAIVFFVLITRRGGTGIHLELKRLSNGLYALAIGQISANEDLG